MLKKDYSNIINTTSRERNIFFKNDEFINCFIEEIFKISKVKEPDNIKITSNGKFYNLYKEKKIYNINKNRPKVVWTKEHRENHKKSQEKRRLKETLEKLQ
jgi:hypothetical protein